MAQLPAALLGAIDALAAQCERTALARDAQAISESYRLRTGHGERLLTRAGEAAAYAAARMPATYASAHAALSEALLASGAAPCTLLDCGAGTGAVSWAADALLALEDVTCLEREEAMRSVGRQLMGAGSGALRAARWETCDLAQDAPLPQAELVCEGYMLGELPESMRLPVAERLWDAAQQMAVFIEPGTPQGFANLRAVRTMLMERGAHISAPCPAGTGDCPMAGEDWCHFTVRVQRTQLHRALKGGEAPFEDEKFCYLAATREAPGNACAARVLRHPQIAPGRIGVTVCEGGAIAGRTFTKKDALWKKARKLSAGDRIE